jgi:hypothetical protein
MREGREGRRGERRERIEIDLDRWRGREGEKEGGEEYQFVAPRLLLVKGFVAGKVRRRVPKRLFVVRVCFLPAYVIAVQSPLLFLAAVICLRLCLSIFPSSLSPLLSSPSSHSSPFSTSTVRKFLS